VVDGELGLGSALEALRNELESAWQSSQGKKVRFRVSEVKLTLETVARTDKDGSGKIRWYVVEAGGGVKSGNERTQTLALTLSPLRYDGQGEATPLDVAGRQPTPDR
jgi:hypothetical protein